MSGQREDLPSVEVGPFRGGQVLLAPGIARTKAGGWLGGFSPPALSVLPQRSVVSWAPGVERCSAPFLPRPIVTRLPGHQRNPDKHSAASGLAGPGWWSGGPWLWFVGACGGWQFGCHLAPAGPPGRRESVGGTGCPHRSCEFSGRYRPFPAHRGRGAPGYPSLFQTLVSSFVP